MESFRIASKPVGFSINLSKTKVMLNEIAITPTVAIDRNIIEKVDRYVYLGKPVSQVVYLLLEMVVKNSQKPVSVEAVQGGVHPYGVIESLTSDKWVEFIQVVSSS